MLIERGFVWHAVGPAIRRGIVVIHRIAFTVIRKKVKLSITSLKVDSAEGYLGPLPGASLNNYISYYIVGVSYVLGDRALICCILVLSSCEMIVCRVEVMFK